MDVDSSPNPKFKMEYMRSRPMSPNLKAICRDRNTLVKRCMKELRYPRYKPDLKLGHYRPIQYKGLIYKRWQTGFGNILEPLSSSQLETSFKRVCRTKGVECGMRAGDLG